MENQNGQIVMNVLVDAIVSLVIARLESTPKVTVNGDGELSAKQLEQVREEITLAVDEARDDMQRDIESAIDDIDVSDAVQNAIDDIDVPSQVEDTVDRKLREAINNLKLTVHVD